MEEVLIDLDQKRIERARSGSGRSVQVRFCGETVDLPSERPAVYLMYLGAVTAGDMSKLEPVLRSLLSDEGFERLLPKMTEDDLFEFMRQTQRAYGLSNKAVDSGEAPASTQPSADTSSS